MKMVLSRFKKRKISKAQMNEGGGYPPAQAATSRRTTHQWADWGQMALYEQLQESNDLLREIRDLLKNGRTQRT